MAKAFFCTGNRTSPLHLPRCQTALTQPGKGQNCYKPNVILYYLVISIGENTSELQMLLLPLHPSCLCFFIQILFLPMQKKFGWLQLHWSKKLLYAYWSRPSYHTGYTGAKLCRIVPLLGSCCTPLFPLPLTLSSRKQRRMLSLFPTCDLAHWIRQQKIYKPTK